MHNLRQSTAYNLMVFMTDSADRVSGKTGLTLTVTASKDGAAFGSISPTVTERGNGWYNLALTTAHTDTLGDLVIRATGTGADPSDLALQIQPFIDTVATNLDATVSSRLATAGYTAPDNASVTAIKAKTDNLPAAPAAVSDIPTAATNASAVRTELATELARVDVAISTRSAPGTAQTISSNADITAIKAKTDNLPAAPAAVSDIPTAATNASAVRTELTTELARVDVAISTRSAPGTAQTINSNADITAIKAKTDNLPSDPADQSLLIAATDALAVAIAALPSSVATATATWAGTAEGAHTYGDILRLLLAEIAGKGTLPSGDGAYALRDQADSKNRVAGTIAGGARTVSTVDGT